MGNRRRTATLLVALALLAGACAEADDPVLERASRRLTETTTEQKVKGGAAAGVDGKGSATAGSADGSTSGDSTGSDASGEPSRGGGDGGGEPAAAAIGAAPGTYTYHVTGKGTGAFGDQDIDEDQQVVYSKVKDRRQTATADQGTTTLEFRDDGAYLLEIQQTQGGITVTFVPEGDALALPADPKVGQTWSWTMKSKGDFDLTLESDLEVLGFDDVTVGGVTTKAVKLAVHSEITGDFQATIDSTRWISLDHRIQVKDVSHSESAFGNTDATSVLKSLEPA